MLSVQNVNFFYKEITWSHQCPEEECVSEKYSEASSSEACTTLRQGRNHTLNALF